MEYFFMILLMSEKYSLSVKYSNTYFNEITLKKLYFDLHFLFHLKRKEKFQAIEGLAIYKLF